MLYSVILLCYAHTYLIYVIPLHLCGYLCEIPIEINVVTDEGNSRNEI